MSTATTPATDDTQADAPAKPAPARLIHSSRQGLLDSGLNVFGLDLFIKSLTGHPLVGQRDLGVEFDYRGKRWRFTIEEVVEASPGDVEP